MAKIRTPHVRIDNRVFNLLPDIGPTGFTIYATLQKHMNRHSGRCYPSYGTLAKITGLDRKTVIKHVDLLVEHGLVHKRAQFIDGRQTSNQYDFRPLPNASAAPIPRGGNAPPSQDRVESADPPDGNVPPQSSLSKPELTKKQISCSHKDIKTPMAGVAYCASCYLDMAEDEGDANPIKPAIKRF